MLVKNRKRRLIEMAEERTILAEERNVYSNIRTCLAFIGIVILLAKLFDLISWWPILIITVFLTLIILGEDVHKLIKLKKIEKELRKNTQI